MQHMCSFFSFQIQQRNMGIHPTHKCIDIDFEPSKLYVCNDDL